MQNMKYGFYYLVGFDWSHKSSSSVPSLCRGQCEDQRRRPVCLRGAGGEDPADSGPVGEREPGSEDPAGRTAAGRRQSLRRLLLHTLNPPRLPDGTRKTHRIWEKMTTDQKQVRKRRRGWKRKRRPRRWRSSVGQNDFAVCTLPFQPSSVKRKKTTTLKIGLFFQDVQCFNLTSLGVCVVHPW